MWHVTICFAIIGGLYMVLGFFSATSAPQAIQVAAQAMAITILPYIVARSLDEIANRKRRDATDD